MTAAAMTVSVNLKLQEQLSGGLQAIQKQLEKVTVVADKLKLPGLDAAANKMDAVRQKTQALGAGMADVATKMGAVHQKTQDLTAGLAQTERQADRTGNAWQRMVGKMQAMKANAMAGGPQGLGQAAGVIAGAVAGVSLLKPIHAYAEQENMLRHMAITQKMSGAAVEAEVSRLDKIFNREALATGQSSKGIAEAARFLLTTGMSMATVEGLLPTHARAATAYNISSDSMGQAVFALHDSFKISEEDMGGALASMALSAKHGHFSVEAFSRNLPQIGGMMNMLGMTGRGNADLTFAALQTVVKNSSIPSEAATNFNDLLHYMVAPIAVRSFAKAGKHADAETLELFGQSKAAGIDLPGMFAQAKKEGVNPLLAFVGKLEQQVKGLDPVAGAMKLGQFLHNQQAGIAAMSLIQHREEFAELTRKLHGADNNMLTVDFITAIRAPEKQLDIMAEQLDQIGRRIGKGFVPVLVTLNIILLKIGEAMNWLDEKVGPGFLNVLLTAVGWFLAFAVVFGVLGIIVPAAVAGFVMVGMTSAAAIVAVLGVVTAISLLITYWDDLCAWLDRSGTRIHGWFTSLVTSIEGFMRWFSDAIGSMIDGIKGMWNSIASSSIGQYLNLPTVSLGNPMQSRRGIDNDPNLNPLAIPRLPSADDRTNHDRLKLPPDEDTSSAYRPDLIAFLRQAQEPVSVLISLDPGLRGEVQSDDPSRAVKVLPQINRGATSPVASA